MLKAVYYINQFYAGIGGEDKAGVGLAVYDEKIGPAIGMEAMWKGEMVIEKIISCGDNYINAEENTDEVLAQIKTIVEEIKPDVFIAGPAFNAGRYGVACARTCDYIRRETGIPTLTGMWHENPAVPMFVKDNYIMATPETAAGMRKAMPPMAAMALKLAKKEHIKQAYIEGYIPTGHRHNEYNEKSGAERVTDILLAKLAGKPYHTEVPLRGFEKIEAAPPVADITKAKVALITTGGLVPMGNPDKLKQAFSVTYGSYDMTGLDTLDQGVYESIHGGYDTTFATADPHRLVPLDAARDLVKEGRIGSLYERFLTTCGIGTNIQGSKSIGAAMAKELLDAGVTAALLTST